MRLRFCRKVRPFFWRGAALVAVILALLLVGCGSDSEADLVATRSATGLQENTDGYTVILRGVVNDTLSGPAQFGQVYDPATGTRNAVVEMVTVEDFAGGMYLAAAGEAWPDEGRHRLDDEAFLSGEDEALTLVYRHGLFRAFRVRRGTVDLTVVSDTLIRGALDAVMYGEVAERGRDPVEGEIEVSGSFSARSGDPGYVIGL